MAYKQLTDLNADVTVSLGGTNRKTGKKNPGQVEGYYLGKREIADTKKKSGVSYIYFFQTAEGNIGVWGKTDLDNKLGQASIGHMTLVKFEKMVETPKGEMYRYSVAQDADNTIEVAAPAEASSSNDDSNYGDDVEAGDDEDDTSTLVAAAAANRSAEERRAKVQALLNSKGKTK